MDVDITVAGGNTPMVFPRLLRFRLGLAAFLGVFLIPIGLSSMRGLAHVLTCRELVESPFEVILLEDADPVVIGSTSIDPEQIDLLCGGLALDVSVARSDSADVALTVSIDNRSESDWRGSMRLQVAGTTLPIDLGRIRRGEARAETLDLDLPQGTTSFGGSLLVGP